MVSMILSFGLIFLVYVLFFFLSFKHSVDFELVSCYECGFNLISNIRLVFSYRFFLLAILFLIFDVEIALMLPSPFLVIEYTFYLFVSILIFGLVYEYFCGSLEWL